MKKFMSIGVILTSLMLVSSVAFANQSAHKGYGSKSKGWGLDKKIYSKAKFLLIYQEELGLSEDQIEKITTLKLQAKKAKIQAQSQIDLLGVDFKSEMYNYPIDEEKMQEIVDKKLEIKKRMANDLISAYAQLKNHLTEEQYLEMKRLYREKKKSGR